MRLLTTVIAGALALATWTVQAAEVPADWVEVKAGNMFTVMAPPGTTFERTRTGDAFSGTFHGAGFDLVVEFGYHREDLKLPDNVSAPAAEKIVLDGKPGTITAAGTNDPAHPYFAGLHVPNVETDILGPLSLVVNGQLAKQADQDIVRRVYQTVTFGYKN